MIDFLYYQKIRRKLGTIYKLKLKDFKEELLKAQK
jgi:hypothetical protein